MKVAILTPSASRNAGGLFNSVRHGAIEMQRQGVNVRVFAPEDENCAVDLPFWSPVEITLYRTLGPTKLGFHLNLSRQVAAYAPDVVHLHGLWTFQSVVARTANRPVVISPRGMLDGWALKNSMLKKRFALRIGEAATLRRAACFHALNRDEADAIRAFGVSAPVAIIPNGIDLPDAASPPPPKWLATDSRKVLLFLGRIHPKKGLEELIRGWAAFRRITPRTAREWRLVIAGWDDGGHLPNLRTLVRDLMVEEDVTFPGSIYHDEKHALLKHSAAFILPSYSEGLPMSVLEAWAYGLPVFMTSHCNLSFAFAERAAIEVTTEPEQLANCLAARLGQAEISKIGAKGREIACQKFGWREIAAQQRKMYGWLMGNEDRPNFIEKVEESNRRDQPNTNNH